MGRALGLWDLRLGAWGGLWVFGAWGLGLGTLGLGTPPNKLSSLMEKENRNEKYIRESIFGFKNIDLEGVVLIGELCCGLSLMRKSHEISTQKCVDKYRPINSFQHLPHTAAAGNFLYFCSNIEKN